MSDQREFTDEERAEILQRGLANVEQMMGDIASGLRRELTAAWEGIKVVKAENSSKQIIA